MYDELGMQWERHLQSPANSDNHEMLSQKRVQEIRTANRIPVDKYQREKCK